LENYICNIQISQHKNDVEIFIITVIKIFTHGNNHFDENFYDPDIINHFLCRIIQLRRRLIYSRLKQTIFLILYKSISYGEKFFVKK